MFVLPTETVKGIVEGRLNYEKILPYNEENESEKTARMEDQAKTNLALAEAHRPICRASGKSCKKNCPLFINKHLRTENGWVCKEFKVYFPNAPFDSGLHFAYVGISIENPEETRKNLKKLERHGAKHVCEKCGRVYARIPVRDRAITCDSCGDSHFVSVRLFIEKLLKS